MARAVLLTVRFHDGRYHGVPDWPPSPMRLFQALVAGAARSNALGAAESAALRWLEMLDPPTIGSPAARVGAAFVNYVPNNDLDAVGRDPNRIAEIRSAKRIRPQIFDPDIPLLYVWVFEPSPESDAHANSICAIAERLYQLGRGVDMAWANGELLSSDEVEARVAAHRGPIHRPSHSTVMAKGVALACPGPGTLVSLIDRHEKSGTRFSDIREATPTAKEPNNTKVTGTAFAQPPKPRFRQVAYNSPPSHLLFNLTGSRSPWSQTRIAELVQAMRDAAVEKLHAAYINANRIVDAAMVEPVFVGRNATNADKAERIRIVPLPSIGSPHVTRAIRRVLVEIPPNCPIPADDIAWSFSGVSAETMDTETGEITDLWRLTPADERTMLSHYGVEPASGATLWRTVTPMALPDARRRRIDPTSLQAEAKSPAAARAEAKGASERDAEERQAVTAVVAALRHAGVTVSATVCAVQREPFAAREARAEAFASGTRFTKESLWHAEINFAVPIKGPLLLGDGRYFGLGIMAPIQSENGVLSFRIVEGLDVNAQPAFIVRALRRAMMARVRDELGNTGRDKKLPLFFTGHEEGGAPARSGGHEHVAIAFDKSGDRLLVLAPHILERRDARIEEVQNIEVLRRSLSNLEVLRAGRAGLLRLAGENFDPEQDSLFQPARIWECETTYQANHHRKLADARKALAEDARESCRRIGLPAMDVEVLELDATTRPGLSGRLRLTFKRAVVGPIMIGRDRHFSGGLFVGRG